MQLLAILTFMLGFHSARQIALYNATEIPMGPRLQIHAINPKCINAGIYIVGNFQSDFEGQKSSWQENG
jgi:hypothetical protein